MKRAYSLILGGVMALAPVAHAATINVTTGAATGAGSLTAAINALNNGDTIAFHIPPETGEVHYIQTPPDGYPLITKNNVTIDGYTQGGASPNTASIHAANNAALKIVLTSTNGNAMSMYHAVTNSWGADIPNLGWGDDEQTILAFFHATNATVRGLVFQATPLTATSQAPATAGYDPDNSPVCKAIGFACNSVENGGGQCQNWHVSGCWFGLSPVAKQVVYCQDVFYGLGQLVATPGICIASYRTQNGDGSHNYFNRPGTIGVAARSANPRAEFNVIVTGYGFDGEGSDYRVSGNFFNVLPDGVTSADMSVLSPAQVGDGYFECGRDNSNITVGTDGDGVNDADEGNIFGPWANDGKLCIDLYSAGPQTNVVIAGNYFNADIHGNCFGPNIGGIVGDDGAVNTGTLRFGSDFNGVSDSLEGNLAYNESLILADTTWTTNTAWVSMRGNSMTNCTSAGSGRPALGDGNTEGYYIYGSFMDLTTAVPTPAIGGTTTASSLSGTCALPLHAPYTNLVVDLYEADPNVADQPQGKRWIASFVDNSAADSNPAVGAFTFSTAGLGLTSGMPITIAVSYVSITQPTVTSISRSGTQSTVKVNDPGSASYGILKSSTVRPTSWSPAGATAGGTATFTDANNPESIYRAQAPTANGQTSPFSDVYSVP